MSISWMSELESSLISFACYPGCQFLTWQGGDKKKRRRQEGLGGGGDYSREVIILNISVKGGLLFEGGD